MRGKIRREELDAATRRGLLTRPRAIPKHNRICHGDFDPSDVIPAADGKARIIDWARVTQGNTQKREFLLNRANVVDYE